MRHHAVWEAGEKQRLPHLPKKNKKFLQKGILIIDYFHMKEGPNTQMSAWGNRQLALWSLMTLFFFCFVNKIM